MRESGVHTHVLLSGKASYEKILLRPRFWSTLYAVQDRDNSPMYPGVQVGQCCPTWESGASHNQRRFIYEDARLRRCLGKGLVEAYGINRGLAVLESGESGVEANWVKRRVIRI